MNYDTLSAERAYRDQLPLEEQFMEFAIAVERGEYNNRWLRAPDTDVMAYVRQETQAIGPPIPGSASLIDGKPFAYDVPCLMIVNLERIASIGPVATQDFEQFMKTVACLSPWRIIGLDTQLGSPAITEWCLENGWEVERLVGIPRIFLPPVLRGAAETVRETPAYLELPAGE